MAIKRICIKGKPTNIGFDEQGNIGRIESKIMASAHTPGPWVWVENGEIKAQRDVGKWDDYICRMPFSSLQEAEEISPTQIPNARLIAVAPELIELAKSARNAFAERIASLKEQLLEASFDTDDINDQIGHYQYLKKKVEGVIAKAEGKTS
jgi:hypothetical protein